MALDVELKTLGVWESYITELVHESLTVDQTGDGLNSTCSFDLIDRDVLRKGVWTVEVTEVEDGDVITGHIAFAEPKVEVRVTDGATVYFAGILSRVDYKHFGAADILLHCDCHDFNQMLEESVVDDFELYGAKTDEEIIDDIFPKYVTGIGFAAHVTGPIVSAEISFENVTVRSVLDTLAAKAQYKWYVGYDKELYYDALGADAPAWHLSDNPDYVNSFPYFDDISKELDATNLVNMVFIIGAEVGLWFQDADSKAHYGEHQAIVSDTNLIDIEDMEYRGNAILAKHKDPIITYRVKTYKDGLRAGMNIRLVSSLYNVDATFLINSLTITFPVDGDPVYEIVCGGLRSSTGAAAHRLGLDTLLDPTIIPPGQLPIASQGWGHDLVFTSADHEKVEWALGTITTAGGQTFAIAAGDTDDPGAMVAKTIVYLDTSVSITELQVTTVETAALGINKIMVAVCWPGIAAAGAQPEVKAGFQVFGSTTEVATFLNATNIIANAITANEIYVNQLSTIVADMGVLTAGTINIVGIGGRIILNDAGLHLYDATPNLRATFSSATGTFKFTSAEAGNPRIEIDNLRVAGYDGADVLQFELRAADGEAYAGGGSVRLNADGLQIISDGPVAPTEMLRFLYDDAGTERAMGQVFSDWQGGATLCSTFLTSWRVAGDPWPANNLIVLAAKDTIAGTDVRFYVHSGGVVSVDGSTYFVTNADVRVGKGLYVGDTGIDPADNDAWVANDVRVGGGLYVGATDQNPPADEIRVIGDIRCGRGLFVGRLNVDPPDDDIWCDGDLRVAAGAHIGSIGVNPAASELTVDSHIAGGGRWYFGAQGAVYYLHRSGENLVWHNASGDHVLAYV